MLQWQIMINADARNVQFAVRWRIGIGLVCTQRTCRACVHSAEPCALSLPLSAMHAACMRPWPVEKR